MRDHGVYTNWAEVPHNFATHVAAVCDAGYHTENLTIEMLGPRQYERHLMPIYRQILEILAAANKRLVVHYDQPEDLRGTMLLYLEQKGRPTDYFVYQPTTQRVRRTSEAVMRSNVQGMDMEYLGFGLAPPEHTPARSAALTGSGAFFAGGAKDGQNLGGAIDFDTGDQVFEGTFDCAEGHNFCWAHEGNGVAFFAGAGCASDSVYVVVGGGWDVVVDDV